MYYKKRDKRRLHEGSATTPRWSSLEQPGRKDAMAQEEAMTRFCSPQPTVLQPPTKQSILVFCHWNKFI
uniref:Uncharacterized protein n=1 Tax=Oryza brachyantha TaxID=4533 RepID=J3L841_ORYBR